MPLPDQRVPMLASFARVSIDPLTRHPVLLYPEGILELDETAAATVGLCNGERSVDEISRSLAETYEAPASEIALDVYDYLTGLAGKGLIKWRTES